MTCPVCGEATRVTYSIADCEGVYRHRKCVECAYGFYTSELELPDSAENFSRLYGERCRRIYERRKRDDRT